MIIATKKHNLEYATTLIGICAKNEEFKHSSLKNGKFPFKYKGWTFERKTIDELIKDRHKIIWGILALVN